MAQNVSSKGLLEEEDPLAEKMKQLLSWAKTYRKPLITVTVIVVVLVAGVSGYLYYRHVRENKALEKLSQAMLKYEMAQRNNGPFTAYTAASADFEDIVKNLGNTDAGRLALIQYADVCYSMKDYDKAISLYKKAMATYGDNPLLKDMILNGLAYAYEGKGDFKNAISNFEEIANNPLASIKDEALFNLGMLYAKTGKPDQSQKAYQQIIKDYPDSIYFALAREKVAG